MVVALLLVGALVFALFSILGQSNDTGLIMNNVYAAGVNLGGMSRSEAIAALKFATDDTYSKLDMTVEIVDTVVTLSPDKTGAKLNVEGVVDAALEYSRTNENTGAIHNISIVPYLNLKTAYIQTVCEALENKYSTLKSDPKHTISGTAPDMKQDEYDTTVVHQTLTITVGTAQYDLVRGELYEQILNAYESNIFEVVADCTVDPPVAVDLDAIYRQYCTDPIDANIDDNYNITPEVFGYGFDLDAAREQLQNAKYGDTITLDLCFIKPTMTAKELAGDLFRDILGNASTDNTGNANMTSNIKKVVNLLNGLIIRAGEEFSFNQLVGEPTVQRGYKVAPVYVGTVVRDVVGGGMSQVASTLYYAVLQADLQVKEHHYHSFVTSFIEAGLDAQIRYGSMDLRFVNNTNAPIRVEAKYSGKTITIKLIGTDTKDYTVEIGTMVDKTYEPSTLIQLMHSNNPGGFTNGQILQKPVYGYDISIYKICTLKPVEDEEGEEGEEGEDGDGSQVESPEGDIPEETVPEDTEPPQYDEDGNPIEPVDPNVTEVLVDRVHYEKQNSVVVEIYTPSDPMDPSNPDSGTTPSDGSEPSESNPAPGNE